AAVLNVRSQRAPSGDYAHSNLIHVLDAEGVLAHQQEGLAADPTATIATIRRLLATPTAAEQGRRRRGEGGLASRALSSKPGRIRTHASRGTSTSTSEGQTGSLGGGAPRKPDSSAEREQRCPPRRGCPGVALDTRGGAAAFSGGIGGGSPPETTDGGG